MIYLGEMLGRRRDLLVWCGGGGGIHGSVFLILGQPLLGVNTVITGIDWN